MMRRVLVLVLLLVGLLALVRCGNSHAWHQKVTVEVETPQGLKSASSVVAMTYRYVPYWQRGLSNAANILTLRGEAFELEVLPGRSLFALVPRDKYLSFKALREKFGLKKGGQRALAAKVAAFGGTVALNPEDYPLMVTFRNINDPASVVKVDPANLAATFGPGISLAAITLTITDEPMTDNITSVLEWLPSYIHPFRRLSGKNGPIHEKSLANILGPGSFEVTE